MKAASAGSTAGWAGVRHVPVTGLFLLVCTGVFVFASLDCGVALEHLWGMVGCTASLERAGGMRLSRVWLDGEWWRLATTVLNHGSVLHLALNMWSLWSVGSFAEPLWGSGRFGLLLFAGGVGGCLASLAVAEAPVVVGASGSVVAAATGLLIARLRVRGPAAQWVEPISARGLGLMLAVLLGAGFFIPVIAQAGHLGGAFVGLCLGWFWSEPGPSRWAGPGLLAAFVLGVMGPAAGPAGRARYHEFLGYALSERGDDRAALRAFEAALDVAPDDPELQNAVAYDLAKRGVELHRAEGLVRAALVLQPDNPDFLDTLGWVLCRRGETAAGLEQIRAALEAGGRGEAEIEGHLDDCAGSGV